MRRREYRYKARILYLYLYKTEKQQEYVSDEATNQSTGSLWKPAGWDVTTSWSRRRCAPPTCQPVLETRPSTRRHLRTGLPMTPVAPQSGLPGVFAVSLVVRVFGPEPGGFLIGWAGRNARMSILLTRTRARVAAPVFQVMMMLIRMTIMGMMVWMMLMMIVLKVRRKKRWGQSAASLSGVSGRPALPAVTRA